MDAYRALMLLRVTTAILDAYLDNDATSASVSLVRLAQAVNREHIAVTGQPIDPDRITQHDLLS